MRCSSARSLLLPSCAIAAAIGATATAQRFDKTVIARGLQRPIGIVREPAGTLVFTEVPQPGVVNGANKVTRLLLSARTRVLATGEPEPTHLAVDPHGELWWTCKSAGVIVRFAATESSPRSVVLRGLDHPSGIAVGPDGTLYFTELPTPGVSGSNGGRNRVLSWTRAGGIQTVSTGEPEPVDIAVDGSGNLYWTCRSAGVILRRDASTQAIEPLLEDLESPNGIAVDDHGTLYFTELPTPGVAGTNGGRNRVSRYVPADRTLRLVAFGDPEPTDVTVSADGSSVYWTCTSAGVIVRARPTGPPVTLTANGEPILGQPVPLLLRAEQFAGQPYVAASSLGLGPIHLTPHLLALSPDTVMQATVGGAPGFVGFAGFLDPAGYASAAIAIPSIPALIGLTVNTAFAVVSWTRVIAVSDTLRLVVH